MTRYCLPLLAGVLLGVLCVGGVSVCLIEFTTALDGKLHH